MNLITVERVCQITRRKCEELEAEEVLEAKEARSDGDGDGGRNQSEEVQVAIAL